MSASDTTTSGVYLTDLLHDLMGSETCPDVQVFGLTSNSLEVKNGDLFVALSGGRHHGLKFVEQAMASGAVAVVWEPTEKWPQVPKKIRQRFEHLPFVAIKDLTHKVGILADRFFARPSQSLKVIGITGTNGKTSCSYYLAQALNALGQRCGLIGTLGYGFIDELQDASHTTPDAIRLHGILHQLHSQGGTHVAMEVSSHALDQGRTVGVRFETATFTNLTQDHLDYHGDMESYARTKNKLFEFPSLQSAVINYDDPFGQKMISELNNRIRLIAYGFEVPDPLNGMDYLHASELNLDQTGLSMVVNGSFGSALVNSPLLGGFSAYNILAVLATLIALGIEFETACRQMKVLHMAPGRMERFGDQHQPLVIVDYAHTPDALEKTLHVCRSHCQGHLICIFGCGGDRDRGKRAQMGEIAGRLADIVVLSDDNPRTEDPEAIIQDILSGVLNRDKVHIQRDRTKAIGWALQNAQRNDVIVVAGKGHEDYQLIGDCRLDYSDRLQVRRLLHEVTS